MNQQLSDSDLIARCLRGDESSWDILIDRYKRFIFGLGLKMGLNASDAEDIFQNVCVSLYQHLDSVRDSTRLIGWLGTAVRQEVWRLGRRKTVANMSDIADIGDNDHLMDSAEPVIGVRASDPQEQLLVSENEYLVRMGLAELSDDCRSLLTLLYTADTPLSYQEASNKLQLRLGSIGPKRRRCLESLRKILVTKGF